MADEARVVLQYSADELEELALVDIAYDILRSTSEPMYYRDLINEVARIRGLTEDELNQVIARVYTEINVDGRFICIGNNIWGLKRWYPVDKAMDKTAGAKHFIRKDLDDDFDEDEDEELFEEADNEDDMFDPYAEDETDDADADELDVEDEDDAEIEEESFEELEEAEAEETDEDEEDF